MTISKYLVQAVWDDPVIYKKLKFYPVAMQHYYEFQSVAQCLLVDKNSIPDPEIISLSYLSFLLKASNDENMFAYLLDYLLKLCLRIPVDNYDNIKYRLEKDQPFIMIDGVEYDASDFDEMREIICAQNSLELPDENIQKEVRDKMEEARRYKEKLSNHPIASLEDLVICVMISTSLKLEDIKCLSIRKFYKILEREDLRIHYGIYLQSSLSGFVKFKDENAIQHWLTTVADKDRYGDVKISKSDMENKLGGR